MCIPQINKVINKEDKERMANIYFHLAGALSNLGRMDEALKAYKVCVCINALVIPSNLATFGGVHVLCLLAPC
jgi:hypothetical protein